MLEKTGGRAPHFAPRDDSTLENCHANCREGEEYLGVVLREAGRERVIGEDLGTVPDYVRPSLRSLGIAGFKIPQWEFYHGRVTPGSEYERLSVATYATHDHPPIRAMWEEAAYGNGDYEAALRLFRPLADQGNVASQFNLGIMFSQSKYYVDALSENIRRGNRTRRESGWATSMVPLGYLNGRSSTGHKIVTQDEPRLHVLRRLWELFLSGGYSLAQLLEMATDGMGLRTRETKRRAGSP